MGKYIHPSLVTVGEGPYFVTGIKRETLEAMGLRIDQLNHVIEARTHCDLDITKQVLELSGLERALMSF